jgi:hypothetical protein
VFIPQSRQRTGERYLLAARCDFAAAIYRITTQDSWLSGRRQCLLAANASEVGTLVAIPYRGVPRGFSAAPDLQALSETGERSGAAE